MFYKIRNYYVFAVVTAVLEFYGVWKDFVSYFRAL